MAGTACKAQQGISSIGAVGNFGRGIDRPHWAPQQGRHHLSIHAWTTTAAAIDRRRLVRHAEPQRLSPSRWPNFVSHMSVGDLEEQEFHHPDRSYADSHVECHSRAGFVTVQVDGIFLDGQLRELSIVLLGCHDEWRDLFRGAKLQPDIGQLLEIAFRRYVETLVGLEHSVEVARVISHTAEEVEYLVGYREEHGGKRWWRARG